MHATADVPATRAPAPATTVEFEYVGPTAVNVTGAITGRRYRFAAPGARLGIDARDGPSLAAVPNLRRRRQRAA